MGRGNHNRNKGIVVEVIERIQGAGNESDWKMEIF